VTVDHRARAEDVRWMADSGECATGAARRLGITFAALEKWARRFAPDDWRQLVAREPSDPFRSERAKAAASARWAIR
jgi:hypothetical protein